MSLFRLRAAVVLGLGALLAAAAFEPVNVPCGKVVTFQLTAETPRLDWAVGDYGAAPTLADGEQFAIVSVRLEKNRSVGKFDFVLSEQKCLGMAYDISPFNPATWEQAYSAADKDKLVHLLYKVRTDAAPYNFEYTYDIPSIPPKARLVVLAEKVEKPAEPAAEPATPATPPAEAPAEKPVEAAPAAPEPTPAAAATPEPAKPEPATPEPAKPEPAKPAAGTAAAAPGPKPTTPAKPATPPPPTKGLDAPEKW